MSHSARRAGRFGEFRWSAVCVKAAFATETAQARPETARGATSHAH